MRTGNFNCRQTGIIIVADHKTIIIASTEGNVVIPGHEEAKVGLNVYRKK